MFELNIARTSKRKIIPLFMESGKVQYPYNVDFKGEFFKRHSTYQKAIVNGALMHQFWNNVVGLQDIQSDQTINLEGKAKVVDNVEMIRQWIDDEMKWRAAATTTTTTTT
jgi:hypothetical protein